MAAGIVTTTVATEDRQNITVLIVWGPNSFKLKQILFKDTLRPIGQDPAPFDLFFKVPGFKYNTNFWTCSVSHIMEI